jgi:hypothetical protein
VDKFIINPDYRGSAKTGRKDNYRGISAGTESRIENHPVKTKDKTQ